MAKPNEITLLFTHILLREKKSSLVSSVCVHQICVCTAFPAYCLCGYCALIAVCSRWKRKKLTNPNACLTKFENTKNNLVHSLTAFMSLQAICAITAGDGKLIICSGFVWLWFTMSMAVNHNLKTVEDGRKAFREWRRNGPRRSWHQKLFFLSVTQMLLNQT